ncbi:MAG: dihydroorotate dehydrogenase-like protein [Spirochaetales bacterium]|nr:dihydroorotate dehydrogenase-like protein [Spirochaetales bacterium]
MADLKTRYLNLELKSPVILGSSPMTGSLDNLKRAEDNGAGAVVLRSLFEELITDEARITVDSASGFMPFSDAANFLEGASRDYFLNQYLKLVQDAKKSLSIPVIPSICCNTHGAWVEYAKRFEACGADAIELNYYILASDSRITGQQVEKMYQNLIKAARKAVSIPLAIKIGRQFSSLSNMIHVFERLGVDGIVLFNRFVRADIDLESLKISPGMVLGSKADYSETLRWIALMAAETKVDFAASTGIHDSDTVIKMLIAGAKCAQLTSAVYNEGFEVIGRYNNAIEQFMDKHHFSSLNDFIGILAQERISQPEEWERAQYMRVQSK